MTTQWIPDGPLDTPYRRARQEWDARMGSALVHAKKLAPGDLRVACPRCCSRPAA